MLIVLCLKPCAPELALPRCPKEELSRLGKGSHHAAADEQVDDHVEHAHIRPHASCCHLL